MRARGGRGFLLPGLLFLFAIDVVPLVYSAWLSLFDWWLLRPRHIPFIGLGNYIRLATDPELRRAVVVTGLFTARAVVLEFLAGLGLALSSASRSASCGRSAWCCSCPCSWCRSWARPCGG